MPERACPSHQRFQRSPASHARASANRAGRIPDRSASPGPCRLHRWLFMARVRSMATITAQMVNELRSKTGQGMMECKKALTETGGDVEKAVEYFRKKGVKTSITERTASEGRVVASSTDHGHVAAAIMV